MFKVELHDQTELNDTLSSKELNVFKQWINSKSYAEISKATCRSEETTKTHIKHILQKTGFKDRYEALLASVANGWVDVKEVSGKGLFAIFLTLSASLITHQDVMRPQGRITRTTITRTRNDA
jgi:DNA-binding CsgD family transcriptional regulator